MPRYYVIETPDECRPLELEELREFIAPGRPALKEQIKLTGGDDDAGEVSYVLLQEGGSSDSIYVHAHETEDEAEQDRFSCRDDGSYRTSPVLAAPPLLAALGEVFYGFLDEFCRLGNDLDYPEGESPEGGAA